MSASSAYRSRRLVATALARAEAWLLEPVQGAAQTADVELRPVVAVVGLASRCGTTTVARALAVELAVRDPSGAAAVVGKGASSVIQLGSSPAARLARALAGLDGGRVRTAGRLCLVDPTDQAALVAGLRPLAPAVMDVGHGSSPGVPASLADHVVLVASEELEPALAAAVASSLARVGPEPLVVLNRVAEEGRWEGRADLVLPESRAGARLALAGRAPREPLAGPVAQLADACGGPRCDP